MKYALQPFSEKIGKDEERSGILGFHERTENEEILREIADFTKKFFGKWQIPRRIHRNRVRRKECGAQLWGLQQTESPTGTPHFHRSIQIENMEDKCTNDYKKKARIEDRLTKIKDKRLIDQRQKNVDIK